LAIDLWLQSTNEKQASIILASFFYSGMKMFKDNVINKGHRFFCVNMTKTYGICSLQKHNYLNQLVTRVHKVYMLPETQGKDYGKLVLIELIV
jgi:hypothetical protein